MSCRPWATVCAVAAVFSAPSAQAQPSAAGVQTQAAADPSSAADAGVAFLARTAKSPGVVTTASGLEYRVVHAGPSTGLSPKLGDQVSVNYEGKLLDGTVFDSSYTGGAPAVFPVGDLVPAWNEALQRATVHTVRPGGSRLDRRA